MKTGSGCDRTFQGCMMTSAFGFRKSKIESTPMRKRRLCRTRPRSSFPITREHQPSVSSTTPTIRMAHVTPIHTARSWSTSKADLKAKNKTLREPRSTIRKRRGKFLATQQGLRLRSTWMERAYFFDFGYYSQCETSNYSWKRCFQKLERENNQEQHPERRPIDRHHQQDYSVRDQ